MSEKIILILLKDNETDLESMSVPLPPPSPFQNGRSEDLNSSLSLLREDCQLSDNEIEDKIIANDLDKSDSETHLKHSIDLFDNKIDIKINTQTKANLKTNASDEDFLSKKIEVTLQSLNEELDRLEAVEANDEITSNTTEAQPLVENVAEVGLESSKECQMWSKVEAIKSKLERNQSPIPVPSPRVVSPLVVDIENDDDQKTRTDSPVTNNQKTSLFMSKSQSSSPVPSSVSPTNDSKLSITEEVLYICRPRVRLTNFSIGSYKKEVDIYDETPSTAPVVKSFTNYHSMKMEKKNRSEENIAPIDKNVTQEGITTTSSSSITTVDKPKSQVIQTLTTSGPRINRIQSWSGQKAAVFERNNIRPPVKTSERYVSQVTIKRANLESDAKSRQTPIVKSLVAKTEDQKRLIAKSDDNQRPVKPTNVEKVTISIKPGLESIILSNCKQNASDDCVHRNTSRESHQTEPKVVKAVERAVSDSSEKASKVSKTIPCATPPVSATVPPVPPPIPPPVPKAIPPQPISNSLKNPKIFHPKGWNSDGGRRSGTVPKVKHVEPPASVNVRDQLLNEIKNFGGKNSLKKVFNSLSK